MSSLGVGKSVIPGEERLRDEVKRTQRAARLRGE
jgi:hypothetical protein